MMDRYLCPIFHLALIISLCPTSKARGAAITIPLREVAKEWLEAKGIKDASKDLKEVLDAAEKGETATKALVNFEKSILDGKPVDPDKHALAVALNLLRLDDYSWLVVVPDYKDKEITAFVKKGRPTLMHRGSSPWDIDVATFRGLRQLGKVECRIKKEAVKVDCVEVAIGKPGTARLTFSLWLTVSSNASKADHPKTFGPYRITAWEDVDLRRLKKWK